MDEIVQMKVTEAIAEERANHRKTEQELIRTKEYLKVTIYLFIDSLCLHNNEIYCINNYL